MNLLINMSENVRHWKQTTTGRKNIPIAEFEKSVKKPKAKAKKADAEYRYVRSSLTGRMPTKHGTGLSIWR